MYGGKTMIIMKMLLKVRLAILMQYKDYGQLRISNFLRNVKRLSRFLTK